jgi:hypothetical protein
MARFFRRGVSRFYFLPACANLDAPTSGEITAGKELTGSIADIAGWEYTNQVIETPDYATTFDSQIGGPDKAAASSFTLYDGDQTADATLRAALAKGTAGFVLLAPYGATATKRAEVWPATVIAESDRYTTGNEAAKYMVQYSVTSRPHQNAAMP